VTDAMPSFRRWRFSNVDPVYVFHKSPESQSSPVPDLPLLRIRRNFQRDFAPSSSFARVLSGEIWFLSRLWITLITGTQTSAVVVPCAFMRRGCGANALAGARILLVRAQTFAGIQSAANVRLEQQGIGVIFRLGFPPPPGKGLGLLSRGLLAGQAGNHSRHRSQGQLMKVAPGQVVFAVHSESPP
jgi:hypothetical protein